MNLRAPWLTGRWLAIRNATSDGLSIYATFFAISYAKLGDGGLLTSFVLKVVACWIGLGYVGGSYSATSRRGSFVERTIAEAWIPCGCLLVVVMSSWVTSDAGGLTLLRGFLVPSLAISHLVSQFVRKKINRASYKIFCGEEYRDFVEGELRDGGMQLKADQRMLEPERFTKHATRHDAGKYTYVVSSEVCKSEGYGAAVEELLKRGVRVIGIEEWIEGTMQVVPACVVSDEWFIVSEGFKLRPGRFYWRVKRICDLIGGITLMVATAPVVAAAALMIYLEDGGPVFYTQVRTGLYGKRIVIRKLRSMIVNAEDGCAKWAESEDSRITKVGKYLRLTRIDELPQLWSVVKGDLSLIGPRPERPEMEEVLVDHLRNYRYRHWIRPGLSGWAQVCFRYGASIKDSKRKLAYDIYYLRNAGFLMDLLIAVKTLRLLANIAGAEPVSGGDKGLGGARQAERS